MPTLSQQQIEEIADRFAELETENQSLADDLAEVTQERDALKAQLQRLMADRSYAA